MLLSLSISRNETGLPESLDANLIWKLSSKTLLLHCCTFDIDVAAFAIICGSIMHDACSATRKMSTSRSLCSHLPGPGIVFLYSSLYSMRIKTNFGQTGQPD